MAFQGRRRIAGAAAEQDRVAARAGSYAERLSALETILTEGLAWVAREILPVALAGMKEIWVGKRLFVRIGDAIPTTGKTVDDVHRLGQDAVTALLPLYHEPTGRKPLRRWLTGLF